MHGQTVSKWEVVQEVLPKQAPDAAKANERDGIGKCENKRKKQKNKQSSVEAIQRHLGAALVVAAIFAYN